jgi:hypothetical protein
MNTNIIIGLCGNAGAGKDTFCNIAKKFLSNKKVAAARVAFADALKRDLDKLCRHKIGCSAFTHDRAEKELIRPLLVAYGTDVLRKLDENHWIDSLEHTLPLYVGQEIIPIVTDVRYPNEMEWIQEKHNGVCVHITRKGIGPANEEERKNNSILKKKADYRIMWPSFGEKKAEEDGDKYVRRVLNPIFKKCIK